jgi:hypothetical protein
MGMASTRGDYALANSVYGDSGTDGTTRGMKTNP